MTERERLAEIARAQAKANQEYEAERAKKPSELQEKMLYDACGFFEVEPPPSTRSWNPYYDWTDHPLDPLKVRINNDRTYSVCEYDHAGITLVGHYLWGGGDHRYHRTSSPWTVRRRRFMCSQTRQANNLGDIVSWLR